MKKTDGTLFNPQDEYIYFLAGMQDTLASQSKYKDILLPVNEIKIKSLAKLLKKNNLRLFVDSGVFNLVNTYAKKNNLTMDEALLVPAEQLAGYDALVEKFIDVITHTSDYLWGYVEIGRRIVTGKRVTLRP